MQSYQLEGAYTRQGQKLFSSTLQLILQDRKNPKGNQPPKYLIMIKANGQRTYVSGLFKNQDSTYRIDYQGQRYHMTLTDYDAKIIRR